MSTCWSMTASAAFAQARGTLSSTATPASRNSGLLFDLGHLKDGEPQGLAGNGAPVRAAAADLRQPLDDGDRLPCLTACMAAPSPPGPVPMTTTSCSLSMRAVSFIATWFRWLPGESRRQCGVCPGGRAWSCGGRA